MTAKKKNGHRGIALRITSETYEGVEKFRSELARERPGSNPSLSDAIRVLITRGLEAVK